MQCDLSMQVWSFSEVGSQLKPVKIEISLIPGLPEFIITGLPDQALKESMVRIKSALRCGDFQLPKAEKIIINLSPANEKKSGQGIELAIALAYLWETNQLEKPSEENVYVYGELGLKGEVRFLEELNWAPVPEDICVWTGKTDGQICDWPTKTIETLSAANQAEVIANNLEPELNMRPEFEGITWGEKTAELLALLAHGGHHALLAGPAGSGKSTLARSLYQILPDPNSLEAKSLRRWNRYFKRDLNFRPYENPHHSSTVQALLGGGNPPVPGVITRAHHGLLVMDEFLEFPPKVREGLREALETSEITIARKGFVEKLPAEFQLVATTNLCPCGEYVPGRLSGNCRFTLSRCQSYQERLSGPLMDRFDILSLSNEWERHGPMGLMQIYDLVLRARKVFLDRGQSKVNGRLTWDELMVELQSESLLQYLPSSLKSRRRALAILRVARSIADLAESPKIRLKHLNSAINFAWKSFF